MPTLIMYRMACPFYKNKKEEKTTMKKIIALVLVLTMVMSMTACGGSKDTYELRCSTNLAATSTVGQGLAKFVELVNEKSGGKINATANFGSELGSQAEQVAMAKSGDLEMVCAAPGTGPGAYEGAEQLMLFEFPFLFKDNNHYRRVMKATEAEVNAIVAPLGFTAMAGMSQGSRDVLTTVPVTCLEDMQDLISGNYTPEDMARVLDTIPYEILTSVSARVKRIYVRE